MTENEVLSNMSTESAQQKLAEYIREMTDNGRIIIEFLESMKNGEIEGSTLADRVEAELMLNQYRPIIEEWNR